MKKLKTYWVTFDWSGQDFDHVRVTCHNKRQVKKILENHYGIIYKIREIEEIWWE